MLCKLISKVNNIILILSIYTKGGNDFKLGFVYSRFLQCIVLCNVIFFQNTVLNWGHSGRVVTLSPPTSEAGIRFPARPQVGKLVVACRWSAIYSTEP